MVTEGGTTIGCGAAAGGVTRGEDARGDVFFDGGELVGEFAAGRLWAWGVGTGAGLGALEVVGDTAPDDAPDLTGANGSRLGAPERNPARLADRRLDA